MIPITDTHLHLWDTGKLNLPWLASAPPLNKDHLISHYREVADDLGVKKAVYMEVDVAPESQKDELNIISSLIEEDSPLQAGVFPGNPADASFPALVEKYQSHPHVKGVRKVLHTPDVPKGHILENSFIDGLKRLGKANLSFDICIRPSELSDASSAAERCPETMFIIDHCGNADPGIVSGKTTPEPFTQDLAKDMFTHTADDWKKDMSAIAQHENTICKLSGIVARVDSSDGYDDLRSVVLSCIDIFGTDRVITGGDWPVADLGAGLPFWFDSLRDIIKDFSEDEQTSILSGNADKLFGI